MVVILIVVDETFISMGSLEGTPGILIPGYVINSVCLVIIPRQDRSTNNGFCKLPFKVCLVLCEYLLPVINNLHY